MSVITKRGLKNSSISHGCYTMLKMGFAQATLRIATTTVSIHASFTRTIALRGVITTKIAREKSLSMKSLHCVLQCVSSAFYFFVPPAFGPPAELCVQCTHFLFRWSGEERSCNPRQQLQSGFRIEVDCVDSIDFSCFCLVNKLKQSMNLLFIQSKGTGLTLKVIIQDQGFKLLSDLWSSFHCFPDNEFLLVYCWSNPVNFLKEKKNDVRLTIKGCVQTVRASSSIPLPVVQFPRVVF